MKYKKHLKFYALIILLNWFNSFSHEKEHPITTTFPFLLISPDAIASGRGDIGGASSPDIFSQYSNSSKYVFSLPKSGIGMSYTPYLNKLSRDIFLVNLSLSYPINIKIRLPLSIKKVVNQRVA